MISSSPRTFLQFRIGSVHFLTISKAMPAIRIVTAWVTAPSTATAYPPIKRVKRKPEGFMPLALFPSFLFQFLICFLQ